MLVIRFNDGSQQVYKNSVLLTEVIKNTKFNTTKTLIAISVNNQFANLNTLITEDSDILFFYDTDPEALNIIRYSCAHLLGYAIKIIWPSSQIANHNITKDGFYCDIDIENSILEKDLVLLEASMLNILKKEYNILYNKVSINQALKIFLDRSETYKIALINEISDNLKYISIYSHEKYIDLDIGMQALNIKYCKHFKLQSISGAYWKKNHKNKMLQRIYGTAWSNIKQLNKHLNYIKELEKRDHRKIGKFLKLYHTQAESPGMIFWHHHGYIIFRELEKFIRHKLKIYEYQEVKTPLLIDKLIWKDSGHWDNYRESIFTTFSENREYCIKPMNCPGHVQIFNIGLKSYRDLPIRMAEFGSCHRNESSGALHGLMRIRNFTQDDAHIFCMPRQVRSEINHCIKMIYDVYNTFNFKNIIVKLSTRPKKRIGSDLIWDQSEQDLSDMLCENNLKFEYQAGEGAFYGPKIEFILQDSLNRHWQCGTIQLDFYLPIRLKTFYIDEKNIRQVPVMIHRAILGSMERFIGILIEENLGNLPTWLSPIQIIVLSISSSHIDYVNNLIKIFSDINIRISKDIRNEKIGFKIREHTLYRIPYMIICGDKEIQTNTISIRTRNGHNYNMIEISVFIQNIQKEIATRSFHSWEE